MASTDFDNYGQAPYLNSNEQNLLLNALKSNHPSDESSGGSLDPDLTQLSNDGNAALFDLEDNSFLDSAVDPSFSWDLEGHSLLENGNETNQQSTNSDDDDTENSPLGQTGDKRKEHPEETGDSDEGGNNKRRGSEEGVKVAKKPGRKPLTSEPTSKRKAQNRAAQRAFRERKEKHLRDLETKVEDLEKASEATNHENGILRAQVERLQAQVAEYKKRMDTPTGSADFSSNASLNKFNWDLANTFDFEFPQFGTAANAANGGNKGTSSEVSQECAEKAKQCVNSLKALKALDSMERNSADQSFYQPSSYSPNGSIARSMSTSTGIGSNYFGSSDKVRSPTYSTDKSTTESPASLGLGSSCVTTPEASAESPGQTKSSNKNGNRASASPSQPKTPGPESVPSLDWFATKNNNLFDPVLFGDYREPQDNILSNADLNLSFFDDAFPWNPNSNFSAPFPQTTPNGTASNHNSALHIGNAPGVQQTQSKPSLMSAVDAVAAGGADSDELPRQLTCAKLWDRVQRSEKVLSGEADMDDLCSQLKAKAKCGGPTRGAVVDEKDVDAILGPDPAKSRSAGSGMGMRGIFS